MGFGYETRIEIRFRLSLEIPNVNPLENILRASILASIPKPYYEN